MRAFFLGSHQKLRFAADERESIEEMVTCNNDIGTINGFYTNDTCWT